MVLCFQCIIWIFASVMRAFKKFDGLDKDMRNRLLLVEQHMALVRNLTTEELIKVSLLSDEEIEYINTIHDYHERIQRAREKIAALI